MPRLAVTRGICQLAPARGAHGACHRYDDTNLEAEIDGYDRRRDGRHNIPESDWRQVERFGKPSLYGWSQDEARQVSVPERQDFGAFVRRQGFKLD